MTETTTVLQELTELFRDLFDDESLELNDDTTADQVEGWDSQMHVMLIVAAEQRFGIKFRTAELESLRNVGQFVQLIESKRSGS
ncbi:MULTISPECIES: acyl carrier protein [Pseudomonas]|jgi:acyl carrier protein|uniref:Acyl carrier protein n=1 Tax=Pseudomonas coleopterorum TaxID=1605838 RepID=A0AAJ6LVZ8_9PSED|nr:acyl carrier protein [Pseudomonas coleopterorum]MBD8479916.1 acyl carrier protein [Pseudomonas coleopterorum]MBD8753716.1 acyl carrier protein [Pseudomonas coleopterorum]MBD8770982.1 acyl carrier protein [Pseudomonas coleopterorum]WNC08089.1 acyl carrier protein [Pseudomonas coleopterorum]SEE25377.1 acyl carrier protein [Pseudomonas coleopterorum]